MFSQKQKLNKIENKSHSKMCKGLDQSFCQLIRWKCWAGLDWLRLAKSAKFRPDQAI